MAKTRWQIRRDVGDRLSMVAYGICDEDPSADKTALKDADVLPILKDNWFTNQWAYFPSLGPTMAKVTAQTGGVVAFTPALAATTLNVAYELWKTFDPRRVNAAINQILTTKGVYNADEVSNLVADQYGSYVVTSLANRILSVAYLDSNSMWQPIKGWVTRGRPGNLTFDLTGAALRLPAAYPTATLRISYERFYDALATEGATTDAPSSWLEAAVIEELYIEMLPRTQKADRDQIKENIGLFGAEARIKAGNRQGPSIGPSMPISRRVSS
jgi:hypothetical protein